MSERVRRSFDRIAEQYAADFADELSRKPYVTERPRAFAGRGGGGPVVDVGRGAAGCRPTQPLDPLPRGRRAGAADSVSHLRKVVAFYSLIYEGAEGTGAALAEFRRVLRSGGPLLVAVHAGEGVHHFGAYKGMEHVLFLSAHPSNATFSNRERASRASGLVQREVKRFASAERSRDAPE